MVKVTVKYFTDNKWFMTGFKGVGIPTDAEIQKDWVTVFNGDIALFADAQADQINEHMFSQLNLNPRLYIQALPPGVKHTSMSVGDIIENQYGRFICLNEGWKKLS